MLDFDVLVAMIFGVVGAGIMTLLKLVRKKPMEYLFVFGLLYIYLGMVINYTIFPIMYNDVFRQAFVNGEVKVNMIPLIKLSFRDFQEPLLNIILFVPFGFLTAIFLKPKFKKVIIWAILTSAGIELLQYIISYVTGVYFRVSDINDIIFNTLGAVIGLFFYILFRLVFRNIAKRWNIAETGFLKFILS